MEHDQRDRRDWPEGEDQGTADTSQPSEPAGPADPGERSEPYWGPEEESSTADATQPEWSEPVDSRPTPEDAPPEEATTEDRYVSASDIESWPSQDSGATEPDRADEPRSDETRPWATEPPEARRDEEAAWATRAPEGGEVHEEPEAAPSEVEAHPASRGEPVDASTAAAAVSASSAAGAAAHTVPDTESSTGESTQCPRCGTENRPGLAFCRNCGQRLVTAGSSATVERPGAPEGTQQCPRCGTHNRAGVAFCQNCGANLRGTGAGYVPPAVAGEEAAAGEEAERRGAVLGPVVLLIGVVGLITGYLLPFLYGTGSLFDRAWGADGYGIAFWNGYPEVGAELVDQAYFGLTGPVPLLALLLIALAVAGFMRAAPGLLQTVGLAIALIWSVGLVVLFGIVEVGGNWEGDLVGLLRALTPAGIIFFLASLIVVIGTLTRFAKS